jgi:hypothetical protein
MRTVLIILLAVLVIGAIGSIAWKDSAAPVAPNDSDARVYSSPMYPVSFRYPDSYVLEERDNPGSGERLHHTITLMRAEDLPPPQGGEGPPAISIDLYQNNLDKLSTETWIRNSSTSNFKLSPDGILSSTTIAGQPELSYSWDGLYRGETVVRAREDFVVAFSVTYLSPEDDIRRDFEELVRTVTFK